MPNRIIKESICGSESLASVSIGANFFFMRLLPLPDDHGCFDARIKFLRTRLFPFMLDKVKETDIKKWIDELVSIDTIRLWTAMNGNLYGYFPNWSDHQRIRSLHARKTPEPPESITSNTSISADKCGQLTASDGLNPNPNLNHNPEKDMSPDKQGDPSPVKIKNSSREPSDTVKAETAWIAEYENQIGETPNMSPAKDRTILKGLIKDHGLEAVFEKIPVHIAGRKFLTIGGFKTLYNDLGIGPPVKKTTIRKNLDLLKEIDLGDKNDTERIQAGNGDNGGNKNIRRIGA